MHNSKYSNRSSSVSSSASSHQSPANKLKSPVPSDYEYVGRLVTRERPIVRKSKSIQQNFVFPRNTSKYHHSMGSQRREVYDDVSVPSSDDDIDDPDDLNKPLGVIRISDRHFREIYRLPTPPPKVKRVYHRLRSPETKVIERVFVRRPPPQIIENIIEVPPEKVRIINREKYLEKSTPVTRSKLVHLKSRHHQREEEQQQQQTFIPSEQYSQRQTFIPSEQSSQQQTFIPSEQYSQQQTFIPSEEYSQQQATTVPFTAPQQTTPATTVPFTAPQQTTPATTLVYPPQPNMRTVGYIESTVPPHIMFNSKQPLQVSPQQISNHQMVQSTPYNQLPQQTTSYQMMQPTPYGYPQQQSANYQMVQPTPYAHPPQQIIPNSPYGYTQY